ncbi:uncharacterized protein BXZ73DRAFT_45000 [Epithele typhae]|uniref:uncharacterized protein n=1 Tax=Epithele typhae TaxID=378194 RepID=UPI00200825EF|nr:uncharacterized protein BXZ73DRAFT_45000 [Epithele typhae]KAH9936831.1 hypothetical protein BXZ73DRAFT_45000 [Epithele typhae]
MDVDRVPPDDACCAGTRNLASCSSARARRCAEPDPPRRRRCQEPPRVSVESNPKPRAPTQYSEPCTGNAQHEWTIQANAYARTYFCLTCKVEVKEKKDNGYWTPVRVTLRERRANSARPEPSPPHYPSMLVDTTAQERTSDAGSVVAYEHDTDIDTDTSDFESAIGSPQRTPRSTHSSLVPAASHTGPASNTRRSSARTSGASDAPSSLLGLTGLRRVSDGHDGSSPVAHAQPRRVSSATTATRRVSGATSSARSSHVPAVAAGPPLVSRFPKPDHPVATPETRCRASARHAWKNKWANGSARHYVCTACRDVVKEKKKGCPEVWVPYS